MRTMKALLVLLCLSLAGASAADAQSGRPSRLQIGTLDCDISGGIGLIIGSRKEVTCMFTPAGQAPREVYVGAITKFGLDIGGTTGGRMVWTVYAETTLGQGSLAGAYVGASAEATVALGLGANALIGGSNRTIALQPISLQGQAGLNIAAGVTELQLSLAR